MAPLIDAGTCTGIERGGSSLGSVSSPLVPVFGCAGLLDAVTAGGEGAVLTAASALISAIEPSMRAFQHQIRHGPEFQRAVVGTGEQMLSVRAQSNGADGALVSEAGMHHRI